MKQAASMQKEIERIQKEMSEKTVTHSVGGGMVTATARGDGTLVSIRIDPKAVAAGDMEMLEDSVVAAVNGALAEAREMVQRAMNHVTAGLPIPGLNGR